MRNGPIAIAADDDAALAAANRRRRAAHTTHSCNSPAFCLLLAARLLAAAAAPLTRPGLARNAGPAALRVCVCVCFARSTAMVETATREASALHCNSGTGRCFSRSSIHQMTLPSSRPAPCSLSISLAASPVRSDRASKRPQEFSSPTIHDSQGSLAGAIERARRPADMRPTSMPPLEPSLEGRLFPFAQSAPLSASHADACQLLEPRGHPPMSAHTLPSALPCHLPSQPDCQSGLHTETFRNLLPHFCRLFL